MVATLIFLRMKIMNNNKIKYYNMKNFYATYDFNSDAPYVSKVETSGFSYPASSTSKPRNSFHTFRHEGCPVVLPLNSPIFEGEFNQPIVFSGNVVLRANYKPELPVILKDVKTNVNLNGKTVVAPIFAEVNKEPVEGNSDSYAFWVKAGAELTIEGDGDVIAQKADYSMAVWANGGKVVIKGGKFYNNGDNSDLIYASDGSQVEIYGGEFHANENKGAAGTKNKYPALNIKDKDRATTTITVFGGKFYGFNPANNVSEGANTNFVAPGYKSVEVEPEVWEVVAE